MLLRLSGISAHILQIINLTSVEGRAYGAPNTSYATDVALKYCVKYPSTSSKEVV
jgi:hypothetical protein